jgi:hypothetical protein
MKLRCRVCDKDILAENINIQLGIAKCPGCNAVFDLVDELKLDVGESLDKRPAALPKQFHLDNWGPELTITHRWYTHSVWLLLIFCIFWDGFLVMWYSTAASALASGQGSGMLWLMFVFPLLHVAVGVGLTYFVISCFVNKTVIRAAAGELTVTHGPLPWGGSRHLLTSDLKQIFCVQQRRHQDHDCRYTYNVEALQRDGSRVTLLGSLPELDQARFIEQHVEQHLKLRDEPVAGEARV